MNEISIVMHLLSKKEGSSEIGSTKKEIMEILNVQGKSKSTYFNQLIVNLAQYLEPLGLQIRFNPLNVRWFISFESELSDFVKANPFKGKPRLAATLFCVLTSCLKNSGIAKISEIKELRNKKDILDDLKDLQESGFVTLDKEMLQVKLTPLIGYQLDLEKLFVKLALKLKE